MHIRTFSETDKPSLFKLLENEGSEWGDYWGNDEAKYTKALENSIVYVIYEDEVLCGYCRCRDDDGYGIYIYDLLVDEAYRGRQFGRALMDKVCSNYPHDDVYVMSDVDDYYQKQGYTREGTIFKVRAYG